MLADKYAQLFATRSLDSLMKNVSAKVHSYKQNGVCVPTTVTDEVLDNCYTVSPYTMLVGYGQEELVKLPFYLRPPLRLALSALSRYLRYAEIDKVQILNNFCLSTNILSRQFQSLNTKALTEQAIDTYPRHALLLRSINAVQHAELMKKLHANGWQFIASRQVYLVNDRKKSLATKDNRKDLKLLNDSRYRFLQPVNSKDYLQIEQWYNRLYLDKYSVQNVQFSASGLQALHEAKIIDLYMLYDTQLARTVGTIGMVSDDHYITVPIVGYDLEQPIKEALYRRLVVFSLQSCGEKQWLNQSAGAAQFKRNRGAEATIEYTGIYTPHLVAKRRCVWDKIHKISPYYEKGLKRWKL